MIASEVSEGLEKNRQEIRGKLLEGLEYFDPKEEIKKKKGIPVYHLERFKKAREVFAVLTDDGRELFPKFQFHFTHPLRIMKKILEVVPEGAHGWPLLSWFFARSELLEGRRPYLVLKRDPKQVLEAAARVYSRED